MAKFTKLNIGDAVASSGGRVWKKLSSMLQLSAPTLSLDGDTLTITDESKLATSFDILVDGEVKGTATSTTFDLSTLELAEGTYSISVIAKADGYKDSAESEAVSYEVAAVEDELQGTWVFNNTINPTFEMGTFIVYMSFESNGRNYTEMEADGVKVWYNSTVAYKSDDAVWNNSAYKTINISTTYSELYGDDISNDEFLSWLTENATKTA